MKKLLLTALAVGSLGLAFNAQGYENVEEIMDAFKIAKGDSFTNSEAIEFLLARVNNNRATTGQALKLIIPMMISLEKDGEPILSSQQQNALKTTYLNVTGDKLPEQENALKKLITNASLGLSNLWSGTMSYFNKAN